MRTLKLRIESLESRQMLAGDIGGSLRGTPKIVGGHESNLDDYPWMISLQDIRDGDHFCGATLIAPDKALTAAHCLEGENKSRTQASVGALRLSQNDGEEIGIDDFFLHPEYNSITLESDIAVLLLSNESTKEPIDYATPADSALFQPGTDALAIGWGWDGNSNPDSLKEVVVPIVSNKTANAPLAYDGEVSSSMLAAGAPGKDACSGDSGGPLVVQDDSGEYLLVGITSWGEDCGEENFPGIYTRVETFTEFIETPEKFVVADDHGDSRADATAVTLGETAGRLSPDHDEDWFSIEVQKGDFFVFQTELGTMPDTVLSLMDSTELLTDDDDGGSGLASRIDWTAPADGTYFLRVTSFDTGTGTYTLNISNTLPPDDHGDSQATATPVGDGAHSGVLEVAEDSDYFSFTAKAGSNVVAEVQLGTLDDSVLTLTRASGDFIIENDDVITGVERNSKIEWNVDIDGTYFLEVSSYEGTFAGSYELVISDASGDDHGNDQATATEILLGTQNGIIDSRDDQDWFAVSLLEKIPYQITTSFESTADVMVTVLDDSGNVLAQDDSQIVLAPIWRAQSDGQYFISVSRSDAGEIGDYSFYVDKVLDGDVNLDGIVDAVDLNTIGRRWLQTDVEFDWQDGDLDGNSTVNAIDLNFLGLNWLKESNAAPRRRMLENRAGRRQFNIPSTEPDYQLESDHNGLGDIDAPIPQRASHRPLRNSYRSRTITRRLGR